MVKIYKQKFNILSPKWKKNKNIKKIINLKISNNFLSCLFLVLKFFLNFSLKNKDTIIKIQKYFIIKIIN